MPPLAADISMEQHPVPQNVTTFQFRLIGDMTLKQFGYLAGGAILAYICYKLPLPFFFTWPLAITSAAAGFGFAFVPIEERPMDVWVLSFIKSVYSPTQYVWQKAAPEQPANPVAAPVAQQPAVRPLAPQAIPQQAPPPMAAAQTRPKTDLLQGLFSAGPRPATTAPAAGAIRPTIPMPVSAPMPSARPAPQGVVSYQTQQPKKGLFDWLFALFETKPAAPQTARPSAPPTGASRPMDLTMPPAVVSPQAAQQAIQNAQKREDALEHKVEDLQKELTDKNLADSRVLELQKQMTELLSEKAIMEAELRRLKQAPAAAPAPVRPPIAPSAAAQVAHPKTPSAVATPAAPAQPNVRVITAEGAIKAGLPKLTTFPNVVTGIIKDSDRNLLPAVLVTVKDKDGLPLRALKTNRLGQFAASTPLPNGTYLVEIEDPRARYIFDRVQITLNGSVAPAIEVAAKSLKEVSRAKLAQELFGKQGP